MLYLIIYFSLFAVWITAELLLAPKGFEDKEGFHYGSPEGDQPKSYISKRELKEILSEQKRKVKLQP